MSEIRQLSDTGKVNETTIFYPDQTLVYSIIVDKALDAGEMPDKIRASFKNGELKVRLPYKVAKEWCDTEKVSIQYTHMIGDNNGLNISLEKDFKCLTKREGEGDMFPNPNQPH